MLGVYYGKLRIRLRHARNIEVNYHGLFTVTLGNNKTHVNIPTLVGIPLEDVIVVTSKQAVSDHDLDSLPDYEKQNLSAFLEGYMLRSAIDIYNYKQTKKEYCLLAQELRDNPDYADEFELTSFYIPNKDKYRAYHVVETDLMESMMTLEELKNEGNTGDIHKIQYAIKKVMEREEVTVLNIDSYTDYTMGDYYEPPEEGAVYVAYVVGGDYVKASKRDLYNKRKELKKVLTDVF